MRRLIESLVQWEPLVAPEPGYTIVIGCNAPLAPMLSCNLRFLAQQDLRDARRITVVVDRPREAVDADVEPRLRARFPSLPLEFLYYTQRQRRVCDLLGWPWVQSWLSWSLGIARTRTRHALLHDFDAMLLTPGFLAERYRAIRDTQAEYLGVRYYEGNGLHPHDRLAVTFELMLDALHVRGAHRPLDLFNHVARHQGRRVDFDTVLYAQSKSSRVAVLPMDDTDMVHPTQLICNYEDHRLGRRSIPVGNGLMLIPYFLYAGDEPALLRSLTDILERRRGRTIEFAGRPLDLSGLPVIHRRLIVQQAFRLESAICGEPREEVRRYFAALESFVVAAGGVPGELPTA